jgi:hypothetical protein
VMFMWSSGGVRAQPQHGQDSQILVGEFA